MALRFLSVDELRARKGAERVDRLSDDPVEQESAIAAAEAAALSYLLVRYRDDQLPLVPGETPALLKDRLADLALWYLAGANADLVAPEVRLAFEDAERWLVRVQRGHAALALPSSPPADTSTPGLHANKTREHMVFGDGGLDGW